MRECVAEMDRLRGINVEVNATPEEIRKSLEKGPRQTDSERMVKVTENIQGQPQAPQEKADPLNRMIHMTNSAAAQKGTLIEVAEVKMKDPEGTEWSLSGLKFDARPRTPVDPAIFSGGTTRLRPEQ